MTSHWTLVSGDREVRKCVHVNAPICIGRDQKSMTRFNNLLLASNTVPENSKWQWSRATVV